MSYYGLADFLEELAQAGELVRVESQVDPVLEIAEVSDRMASRGGKAILFGAVRGHNLPVVANLLASEARIGRALGVERPEEFADRIAQLAHASDTQGWMEKIKGTASRSELRKLEPRAVRTGASQQVVRLGADVDLTRLPALQCRVGELGRTLTAGQVFTPTAESAARSVGCYPLRILDRNRMIPAWFPHDDAARCMATYQERHRQMPVAVVLGGEPAALLAAMAPLPPESDRLALAGLLRGKPLDLVRCRTIEFEVPAEAELVLEGSIDPDQPDEETGPIAAPGGYLLPSRRMPVIHVSAITHRSNPIVPAMVPGSTGDEATTIERVLHRVFLPLVRRAVPDLFDYDLPALAAPSRMAFVSMAKSYAGQARKLAAALWGLRQLMFAKLVVIVDGDVDVRNPQQVWSAVASRADLGRDVIFQSGPPDASDPAGMPGGLGQRMAIDATRKLPGEGPRHAAAAVEMPDEVRRLVSQRWSEYGLGEPR